jgi:DNA-binding LacI/PurR family transcriptional regulator
VKGSTPVIAFFVGNFSGYHESLWKGAVEAADELETSIITFTGASLDNTSRGFGETLNRIFRYAHADCIDGVLFSGNNTLPGFLETQAFNDFCKSYKPKPSASIGGDIPGIPRSMNDNRSGLRDMILHLVKDHGRKRIAFISGPKTNPDAMERVDVYRTAMKELGLPCDERFIH